jgi:DNA-binding transcriptional regulator LsrR (DeoR family)
MPRKPRFRNTGSGKGIKEQLDAATLRRLYLDEKLTQAQIADRYGCTPQFVSLLLREHGIRRSPRP